MTVPDFVPDAALVRDWVKAERWQEIADALGRASDPDAAPAVELTLAAYKAHTRLGNADAAEAWLDLALEQLPGNSTLQRDKGVLHQKRQEWDAAAQRFRNACEARPDVASYHGALGVALSQGGDHAGAVQALRAALAIDESQRGWWVRLARALVHLNELTDAVIAYGRALALQDDLATRSARDELMRQIRLGSRAASAAYYDAIFADSPKYQQSGLDSDYAPVWRRVVDALRELGAQSVLDLGCGPGQFAEFFAANGGDGKYAGVDFSGVAVARARQRCPQFVFEKRELPLVDLAALPAFDSVVCTEVLEHVERDREILAALPEGTRIVASVPNFDAMGHLRVFRSEAEVRERYGTLVDGLQVDGIALSANNTLWLLTGRRSAQALAAEAATGPAAVGFVDLTATAVESVLWSDGARYVEDFLPLFGLPFVPVAESVGLDEPHVALRHDVDWSIESALAMAALEHQVGVRSSYYLLHPDGDITPSNYFGRIENGELVIDPRLFDAASRLLDLGHEVGLHNDLITLALATRRQPGEFLEQIVEAFTARGIPLRGSVAHGSRTCRALGYMNYQIFEEFRDAPVAPDYRDRPELFEHFVEPQVERDGHAVPKFALAMADFGLSYEANFVPRDVYVYDSSARWSIWQGDVPKRFERFDSWSDVSAALQAALWKKPPRAAVQCLVHACHWSAQVHLQPQALSAVRKHRNQRFAARARDAMFERLGSFGNVLAMHSSPRFDGYDREYAGKRQLYQVTSTVLRFTDALIAGLASTCRDVLEVGCGQGDFLALVQQRLRDANPHAAVRALGVDGSAAAIVACATRYPQAQWIVDEIEHFLATHDETVRADDGMPRRHDLVLDKTGAIFIESFEEARLYFERLHAVMSADALYVYVASRSYYEEILCKRTFAAWPKDWLTLAAEVFEPVWADDDPDPQGRGYLKRVFRKVGAG